MHKAIYWLTAMLTWIFLPIAIVAIAGVSAYMYVRDVIIYEHSND